MENLIPSNKQNITLIWSKNMKTEFEIDCQSNQIKKCFTTNQNSKKTVESNVSQCAAKKLINRKYIQKQHIIAQEFTISADMTRISLNDNQKLLGGGCVSSNDIKNKNINKDQNNKIEITHLDDMYTSDDIIIELSKQTSIDLEGEIFPYFKSLLKNQNPSLNSYKMLQKVFMYCIEYILLDYIISYQPETKKIQNNNIKQTDIDNLKKYLKKFEDNFNSNKDKYPLETNIVILEWLNCLLKFDNKDKIYLAKNCTQQDCLIFSSNLDSQSKRSSHQKSVSFNIEGDELIDNYSQLFKQKNPIFSLIGYRRIICQNYTICQNTFANQMDRLFFTHLKSLNRFKQNMSFDVKFYSLFLINLVIQQYKDLNKSSSQLEIASTYINTFLFSKSEGIIQICKQEFKLQLSDDSNESIKIFLEHHNQLKYIASEILKNIVQYIIKQLPSNVYYNEQKHYIIELIKKRTNLQKQDYVNNNQPSQNSSYTINSIPSPSHTQISF